jgi:predicted SnoaL-like aldol condensation-catalyzing enzyme
MNEIARLQSAAAAVLFAAMLLPIGAKADVAPRNDAERTVIGLLDTAFNQKKPAKAWELYGGPYYKQHNPTAPDGKEAIIGLLNAWLPTVPNLRYDIKRIISDGDMVWVHSHVTTGPEDRGQAVVDIFRLEVGKVVEHWDVGTQVPEKSMNDNTMF